MIDHAPRIRAKQQQEADQASIEELERRSAPLHWAMIVAAVCITLGAAIDGLSAHIERYTALAVQEEALVQCLNGKLLKLGGSFVHCDVREIKLVASVEDQQ